MKRIKRHRGFYKEVNAYLKASNENKKDAVMWGIEYWLKHKLDSTKDIRVYARFHYNSEIQDALKILRPENRDEYEDHMWCRSISRPRTRKQKEIHKSRSSSIPHISKIL